MEEKCKDCFCTICNREKQCSEEFPDYCEDTCPSNTPISSFCACFSLKK